MGEVYRADDLKLGQPVALKFLPPDVDRDPARLTQLHTEVRMARQVSHPNVCRVYDIDEVDGHTFLSMEYVDGEDLASLLRRIGRFPEDAALEIARQICAGLAAAHERGVLHRDLKPANVMLDGSRQGAHHRLRSRRASPANRSAPARPPTWRPSSSPGGEVTARSDIYALGLVLYEIFTGQRALEGKNLAELIRKREQSGIVPPSAIVRDLDPEIERAIMRCLQPDPASARPSALAVAAALPGGDPLAAALAAGETPSPEMVAAAGSDEAISTRCGRGRRRVDRRSSLLALLVMYQRVMLVNRVPMPKPPAALEDRAQEALARSGYDGTVARLGLRHWRSRLDYARYIGATSTAPRSLEAAAAPIGPSRCVSGIAPVRGCLIPLGIENNRDRAQSAAERRRHDADRRRRLRTPGGVPRRARADRVERARERPPDWTRCSRPPACRSTQFTAGQARWIPPVYADERMRVGRALARAARPDLSRRGGGVARATRVLRADRAVDPLGAVRSRSSHRRSIGSSPASPASSCPALMVLRRAARAAQLQAGRGDRRGAFRAASSCSRRRSWRGCSAATHVERRRLEIGRIFAAIGRGTLQRRGCCGSRISGSSRTSAASRPTA